MTWMDCKCVKRARSAKAVIPPFGALTWKWPDANADVCMYIMHINIKIYIYIHIHIHIHIIIIKGSWETIPET